MIASCFKMPRWSVLASGLCVVCLGCGSNEPQAKTYSTVTAKGTLMHEGKPLPYYQVMLIPQDGRAATGTTNEQGQFTLGTNAPDDGAMAGAHKVTVTFVGPPGTLTPDMDGYKPPKPPVKLPAKFSSEKLTPLKIDVPAEGSESLTIDVK